MIKKNDRSAIIRQGSIMNEVQLQVEKGKKILRDEHINLIVFKTVLSNLLWNTNLLDEDDWVMYYNDFAGCVGRTGMEKISEWVKEWFQEYNKKEHRIYLR